MITENTNDFIVVTDCAGKIKYASPSYIRKLGFEEHELLVKHTQNYYLVKVLRCGKKLLSKKIRHLLKRKLNFSYKQNNSHVLWTEGNYTITHDFANNQMTEIIMVSREITERKELENKLIFMAYHDTLTQLPNRRYLQKEFPHLVEDAKTNFESLAMFYIDGDNFKQVNDVMAMM